MKVGDPSRKRDEPKRRCMKIIRKNLEKKKCNISKNLAQDNLK